MARFPPAPLLVLAAWLGGAAAGSAAEVREVAIATPDPAGTGRWVELCAPGPDGVRAGFPLAGDWTAAGGHEPAAPGAFHITCTSGAIGKCVRLGYRPWARGPDGRSMRDLHQACVRAVRADYCGDGRSHTVDGTRINLHDPRGIQQDEPDPDVRFEATWGPRGAVCVARPRRPELTPPEALEGLCPARLAGRTGAAACGADAAGGLPGVLLLTDSW